MVNGTGGGGSAGRTVILNIVMQLRKCCNHPYLFAGVEDRKLDPLGEHLINNCGKVSLDVGPQVRLRDWVTTCLRRLWVKRSLCSKFGPWQPRAAM